MKLVYLAVLLLAGFRLVAQDQPRAGPTVSIHPGESLKVTFKKDGDRLFDPVITPYKGAGDEADLVLELGVFSKSTGIILKATNKMKKTLIYKGEMQVADRTKRIPTSLIPINAGLMSFESWPHRIDELVFSGFSLASQK